MARITHRDFSKGLWVAGGREAGPPGTMRQAKAVRALLTQACRSRYGLGALGDMGTIGIQSITRFINARMMRIGNDFVGGFYAGGGASGTFVHTSVLGGQVLATNGMPLHYAKMTPTSDTVASIYQAGTDHLFVAGGGLTAVGTFGGTMGAFKLDSNGATSAWGIAPPPPNLGLSVSKLNGEALGFFPVIDEFDVVGNVPGTWYFSGTGVSATNDFGTAQSGPNSIRMTIPMSAAGLLARFKSQNLFQITPDVQSPKQDWIQMWIYCDEPKNLDGVELFFDCTDSNASPLPAQPTTLSGLKDGFAFQILVEDSVTADTSFTGIADHPAFSEDAAPQNTVLDDPTVVAAVTQQKKIGKKKKKGETVSRSAIDAIVRDLGSLRIASTKNTWTKIRVPKQAFSPIGNATHDFQDTTKRGWANVRRILITAITNANGTVNLNFDKLLLHIGAGLHGDYQVAYTYKNSKTGQRSNPSVVRTIKNVQRDALEYRGILLSPDPQVDTIEWWRTVGNGSILFHAEDQKVADYAGSGKHTDIVADFVGLHENVQSSFTGRGTQYLDDIELPYDNVKPVATMRDVCGPYQGVLFHTDGLVGNRGNLYYSPPGRPESVAGFILVTSDDDSIQRCVYWNGVYCLSESGIHEIHGTPPGPYTATKIFGAPGTIEGESVVPTPFGIVYKAQDGLRVFDGTKSDLVAPDAILPVFRGEAGGDVGASHVLTFNGTTTTAAYHREEYFISNGIATTLAVNLRTGYWREIGVAFASLFGETDTGFLLGAKPNSSKLFQVEQPGTVTDDGVIIPFIMESPGTVVEDQSGITKIVQRLYLDINTNGQTLIPRIHYTGSETSVGVLTLSGVSTASVRQIIEIALGLPGDVLGVELSGSLVQPVEIYGVGFDVHLPESGGALT